MNEILDCWYSQLQSSRVDKNSTIPASFETFIEWLMQKKDVVINVETEKEINPYVIGKCRFNMKFSIKQGNLLTYLTPHNDKHPLMHLSIMNMYSHYGERNKVFLRIMSMFQPNLDYINEIKNIQMFPSIESTLNEIIKNSFGLSFLQLCKFFGPRCKMPIRDILTPSAQYNEKQWHRDSFFRYMGLSAWSEECKNFIISMASDKDRIISETINQINLIGILNIYVFRVYDIDVSFTWNSSGLNVEIKFKGECINNEIYYTTIGHHLHRIKLLHEYPSKESLNILANELNVNIKNKKYDEALDKIENYLNQTKFDDLGFVI